jgi:hypothetical protein
MIETPQTTGSDVTSTPPYTTPTCYFTQQPALKADQFTKLQLETLFYMFYVLPKDIVQALAAQELCRRDWKFHVDLKVWIKARTAVEQQQSHPGVQYIYFDMHGWDIKPFNGAAIKVLSNGTIDHASINMTTSVLNENAVRVVLQNNNANVLGGVSHGGPLPSGGGGGVNSIPGASFPLGSQGLMPTASIAVTK